MLPMSSSYDQLLDAAIQHLENLQTRGVRYVAVTPETLRALSQTIASRAPVSAPPKTVATATPSVTATTPKVVTPPSPVVRMPKPVVPLQVQAPSPASAPAMSSPEKVVAFNALRERVLACVKCPHLVASRKNIVFGVGNIDADLMFVGEAPGADEDAQGEPFVGKAGQLLTKIIEATGLKRSDVYIANILKCRPDTPGQTTGNRKPTPAEMETCIPFLHEQIDLVQPKVLVALGATAVEGLLGKTTGITRLRGNWQTYRGIPLMPTFHPSYLLRNQALAEKRRVWEDMLQVMEKLNQPISEKQRNYFLKAMR